MGNKLEFLTSLHEPILILMTGIKTKKLQTQLQRTEGFTAHHIHANVFPRH